MAVHVSPSQPDTPAVRAATLAIVAERSLQELEPAAKGKAAPPFSSLWEFALAVNRSDAAALAVAGNGSDGGIPIDGAELRKLLGTVWFRSVFPHLSRGWRERLFQVLTDSVPVHNHVVKVARHRVSLSEVSYPQLNELVTRTDLSDAVRADIQLLIAVGRLWGEDALQQCQFTGEPAAEPSRFAMLLQGFRG
jgi:hypothetical protein